MDCQVLVIADLHYINAAKHQCNISKRECSKAKENIERIYRETECIGIDAIALVGDLVDNGNAENAEKDLIEIKKAIDAFNKPVIAICGNHDGKFSAFAEVFPCKDVNFVSGYQFVSFYDAYDEAGRAQRDMAKMRQLFQRLEADAPLIALQHNPIYPDIESNYPYDLINREEVRAFYSQKNIMLSISGHYHPGTEVLEKDRVLYVTVGCLCEYPYTYGVLHLVGDKAWWQNLSLE